MGRGLAGHPRSVRLGSGDNKMRLYTSFCSKISVIWRHGLHIGSAQQHSRPACRSDEFAGKRSSGNGFPSSDRARLLQPLLPHPQEGWWILVPILDIRHLNRTLMKWPFRMITSKQILLRICSGDWIFLLDLKGTYFLIHIAPPPGDTWDSPSKEWLINSRSSPLGCPWLPALLRSAWMPLFRRRDRWESASWIASTTSSFWPSLRTCFYLLHLHLHLCI